jgi:hypothetical protein
MLTFISLFTAQHMKIFATSVMSVLWSKPSNSFYLTQSQSTLHKP